MSYRWQPTGGVASELADAGLDPRFDDQATAEAWLGEFYDDLAEAGVTDVTLYEEDRLVYGPMSLSE